MISFNVILFDNFETLDAFGPVEVIGKLPEIYTVGCYSLHGGLVESSQQIRTQTIPIAEMDTTGILLIPGGMGTRNLVTDKNFIGALKVLSKKALYVLAVCTGSALLAKTDLINGRKATSNKKAYEWASSNGIHVDWVKKARWIKDGKYYTSSGVSAGIDMALGFISDMHGTETAVSIAGGIEYIWNRDRENDPFAVHQE